MSAPQEKTRIEGLRWMVLLTVIVGLPRALLRAHGRPGVWVSPDRGLELPA